MSLLTCKSRIYRKLKRGKDHSLTPFLGDGSVNPNVTAAMPECRGLVTASVSIESDGGCSCCSSNSIEVSLTCAKCNCASIDPPLRGYALANELDFLINEALTARQEKAASKG
jgi:hypothetical protein